MTHLVTPSAAALFALLALAATGCSGVAPPPVATPATEREKPAPPVITATPGDTVAAPEALTYETWFPPATGVSAQAQQLLATLLDPSLLPLPTDLSSRAAPRRQPVSSKAGITAQDESCNQVQLLALSDSRQAQAAAREAARVLDVPAFVVKNAGLYAVRAGDCLDDSAAGRLRERARRLAYDGAWVVTRKPAP